MVRLSGKWCLRWLLAHNRSMNFSERGIFHGIKGMVVCKLLINKDVLHWLMTEWE